MNRTGTSGRLLLVVSVCLFADDSSPSWPSSSPWTPPVRSPLVALVRLVLAGIEFLPCSLARSYDQCGISGADNGGKSSTPPAQRGRLLLLAHSTLVSFAAKSRLVPLSTIAVRSLCQLSRRAPCFMCFTELTKNVGVTAPWILVSAAALGALADYAVNAGLVTLYMSTKLGISPAEMFTQLTIGNVRDFLNERSGPWQFPGSTLAVFFQRVGFWMLPAVLAPLIFARQMFFRIAALSKRRTSS